MRRARFEAVGTVSLERAGAEWPCALQVVKHEGFIGWYRGLPPALAKNFLTNFVFYLAHSVLKPLYKVRCSSSSFS